MQGRLADGSKAGLYLMNGLVTLHGVVSIEGNRPDAVAAGRKFEGIAAIACTTAVFLHHLQRACAVQQHCRAVQEQPQITYAASLLFQLQS